MAALGEDASVLDCRPDGDEVAVTLEGAERAIEILRREGVEHRVVDLNLDEIFEAYVAGKVDDRSATTIDAALTS